MSKKALQYSTKHIVFVAYPGVSFLDLSGPLEAFRVAAAFGGSSKASPAYECTVVSAKGGAVMTSGNVALLTKPASKLRGRRIDTLVTPGAFTVDEVVHDEAIIDWVRRQARDCRRVVSICAGAFMLAKAGLLAGRRATTHWLHCDTLARRYPATQVDPNAIFVKDGNCWTSAGVTTGIDLALALIEEDLGHAAAMNVAKMLVVYLKRAGGQSQYSALLSAQAVSESDDFGELERWIAENPKADTKVEALAKRVNMSPRNFARLYSHRRGRTPAKAVEAIRVDSARRLLEGPNSRIKEIAARSGFSNEEHMRTAFVRNLGISPREYKERFASAASA